MENWNTRKLKKQFIVFIIIYFTMLGLYYLIDNPLKSGINEFFNNQTYISKELKDIKERNLEIEKKLKKQEEELKKINIKTQIIKDYIIEKNKKVPYDVAERYARKIVYISELKGISPYVLSSLLSSESTFKPNPKHAKKTVVSMGGIDHSIWGDDLKEKGVIKSVSDLKNPLVAIEATIEILTHYNEKSKNIVEALKKYKGVSNLGAKQARFVMVDANYLKQKEIQILSKL